MCRPRQTPATAGDTAAAARRTEVDVDFGANWLRVGRSNPLSIATKRMTWPFVWKTTLREVLLGPSF